MNKAKVTSVDEYIQTYVLPEHRDIVAAIRDFMRANAPAAKEVIKWNQPVWQGKAPMVVISANKNHVLLIFSRGAEFTDQYGLLEGDGDVSKHIKLTSTADLNQAALRDYVQQSVQLDAVKRQK